MRFGNLFSRRTGQPDAARDVVVLIDDSLRERTLYRAAALPLLTGLSTIALLTSISWFMTERLIKRIARLQLAVDGIARGDFQRSIQHGPEDELGLLSQSVQKMAEQLNQMWQALRQRHGQQLLHQISGGLAHNLRNTLTGARMAIELVQRQFNNSSRTDLPAQPENRIAAVDGLGIAVSQLEQAEAYVQRLLLVSRGQEAKPQPALVRECLEGLRPGLESTAEHRGVKLKWRYDADLSNARVLDGPTLIAAISNLIWNAIEAGKTVQLHVELVSPESCKIAVEDDGAGPPENLQEQLFDPFVTSKSEGLGLGLPLVRRAAEALDGKAQWRRQENRTVFEFSFPILNEESK
ncbi:MAG: HAMP domain-containing sensor histidine kinase [Pirellulales bacterium]